MSENTDNKSMEFHCAHLGADGVAANFTGTWRQWGQIDGLTVKPTQETLYDLFHRGGVALPPFSSPVQFENALTGRAETVTGKKVLYSGHTGEYFGIVGDNFPVLSHWETVHELLDVLPDSVMPSRVISFGGGSRMLAQFFAGQYTAAGRNHNAFLTVLNGLDGTEKLRYGFTVYSPVCSNTYAKALGALGEGVKHTKNFTGRLSVARAQFAEAEAAAMEEIQTWNKAASVMATSDMMSDFLDSLFPLGKTDAAKNRRAQYAMALNQTVAEVDGNPLRPSAYDLFAGLTRYVADRSQNRNGEEQMEYVTSGPGAALIDTGRNWLELALA